jgi:hypothetical protein
LIEREIERKREIARRGGSERKREKWREGERNGRKEVDDGGITPSLPPTAPTAMNIPPHSSQPTPPYGGRAREGGRE